MMKSISNGNQEKIKRQNGLKKIVTEIKRGLLVALLIIAALCLGHTTNAAAANCQCCPCIVADSSVTSSVDSNEDEEHGDVQSSGSGDLDDGGDIRSSDSENQMRITSPSELASLTSEYNVSNIILSNWGNDEGKRNEVSCREHVGFIELYDKTADKTYSSEEDSPVPTLTPGHYYEVRYNLPDKGQKVSFSNPRFKADGIFFWLEPDDFAELHPRGFQHNLAAEFIVNHYKFYDQLDFGVDEPIKIETDHYYYLHIEGHDPIRYGEATVEGLWGVIPGSECENDDAEELIVSAETGSYFSYEFSVEKHSPNRDTQN